MAREGPDYRRGIDYAPGRSTQRSCSIVSSNRVIEDVLARRGQHYVLRVRGNSMIDEQIRDGDLRPSDSSCPKRN